MLWSNARGTVSGDQVLLIPLSGDDGEQRTVWYEGSSVRNCWSSYRWCPERPVSHLNETCHKGLSRKLTGVGCLEVGCPETYKNKREADFNFYMYPCMLTCLYKSSGTFYLLPEAEFFMGLAFHWVNQVSRTQTSRNPPISTEITGMHYLGFG